MADRLDSRMLYEQETSHPAPARFRRPAVDRFATAIGLDSGHTPPKTPGGVPAVSAEAHLRGGTSRRCQALVVRVGPTLRIGWDQRSPYWHPDRSSVCGQTPPRVAARARVRVPP